ncbi:MAG: hypothetical protein NZO58_07140, partial [Gemmataceae bacterium]|nr:hypothetical protein [Gemmataceae bacterium]
MLPNIWPRLSRRERRRLARLARRKSVFHPQIEVLESRELLAVDVVFHQGELRIVSDGADRIVVSSNPNQEVTLNGTPITVDGQRVLAEQVRTLQVIGGPLANVIDVSQITPAQFVNLTTVVLDGGDGPDVIHGSGFSETILGGAGRDQIHAGTGHDVIRDVAGSHSPRPTRQRSHVQFDDGAGAQTSVILVGPGTLLIEDRDGDGQREIEVTGGDPRVSCLKVRSARTRGGDGLVRLDTIRADGLKRIQASAADLVGDGVFFGGDPSQNVQMTFHAFTANTRLESASAIRRLVVSSFG